MTEFLIDSLAPELKQLIVNRLVEGVAQRKIAEELKKQGISISDVSIGRWWKENKDNYTNLSEPILNIDKIIEERINKLSPKTFEQNAKIERILVEQVLQKLALQYVIIIDEQTKLKQQRVNNHYPTDLISSLKTIIELYLKIKEDNSGIHLYWKKEK